MEEILLIVLAAGAISLPINLIFRRFDIPPIIGYIITGVFIGWAFQFQDGDKHTLFQIAEFGIAFLMFTIGLEFSIGHLLSMKKEVFAVGGLQMIVTGTIIGAGAYFLFGLNAQSSIIVGSALTLSSTAIVLKMLNEKGEIHRPYGKYSLGILLFQDLAVIPLLLMITIFAGQTGSLTRMLMDTAISAAITLAILFFMGRYVLSRILALVSDARSHELFVGAVLIIVMGASALAHWFGFTYSLGAFFAGMLLAETRYKYQVEADLIPFRDLLLGVFFITVGIQIDPRLVLAKASIILSLLVGIMTIKALLIFLIIQFFDRYDISLRAAIILSQVGEFSFAVMELARTRELISRDVNQTVIITVVFSMFLTPFILRNMRTIVSTFIRKKKTEDYAFDTSDIQNHVVVIGYGDLGQSVVYHLRNLGVPYIAIDNNRKLVEEGEKRGDAVIYGNAASRRILDQVHIRDAAAAIVAIDHTKDMRIVSEAIYNVADNANIVVKVKNPKEAAGLHGVPVKNIVDEHDEVARILIDNAITCDIPGYVPAPCRDCEDMDESGTCSTRTPSIYGTNKITNVMNL